MSTILVRAEVWDCAGEWRGSGRVRVADMTPAEMTGEAVRKLLAGGMLEVGGQFRLWVPGAEGWRAEGEVTPQDMALAARITEGGGVPS